MSLEQVVAGDTIVARMTWCTSRAIIVTSVGRRWIRARMNGRTVRFDRDSGASETGDGYAVTLAQHREEGVRLAMRRALKERGVALTSLSAIRDVAGIYFGLRSVLGLPALEELAMRDEIATRAVPRGEDGA